MDKCAALQTKREGLQRWRFAARS